jgi:hypothetical protein
LLSGKKRRRSQRDSFERDFREIREDGLRVSVHSKLRINENKRLMGDHFKIETWGNSL